MHLNKYLLLFFLLQFLGLRGIAQTDDDPSYRFPKVLEASQTPAIPMTIYYFESQDRLQVEFATKKGRCVLVQRNSLGQNVKVERYKGKQHLDFNIPEHKGVLFFYLYIDGQLVAYFHMVKL